MVQFLDTAERYLVSLGFVRDLKSQEVCFSRRGKSLGIFPFGDYLFFHENVVAVEEIIKQHEADRKHVDSRYPITRSLRWTVPNIASIFLFDVDVPKTVLNLTKRPVKDVWGGEIHTISLVDLKESVAYTSDNSKYYLNVEGFSFRNTFADKVDPAIRTNTIIHAIMKKYKSVYK